MTYNAGAPLSINKNNVFQGQDKTNGFLMQNVDGRVIAIQTGFSSLNIPTTSVLYADGIIPFGCGMFYNNADILTKPGALYAGRPANGRFAGVLDLNQGILSGHPIAGYGIGTYMKGNLDILGLVGYKHAMPAVGKESEYLSYVKGRAGDATDVAANRTVYKDWVTLLSTAAAGSLLGLFFGNASGFPIVSIVAPADIGNPVLTGATFGGFMQHTEPENQAIFVKIGFSG